MTESSLLMTRPPLGGVGDDHRLGISTLSDDHIGGGGVHDVPLGRLDLREHIGAGGQVGYADFTIVVGGKIPFWVRVSANHPIQAHLAAGGGRRF